MLYIIIIYQWILHMEPVMHKICDISITNPTVEILVPDVYTGYIFIHLMPIITTFISSVTRALTARPKQEKSIT